LCGGGLKHQSGACRVMDGLLYARMLVPALVMLVVFKVMLVVFKDLCHVGGV